MRLRQVWEESAAVVETVQARPFVIGLHAGIVGRIARLLLGGSGVATGVAWLVSHGAAWWAAAAAFAGAVVFYLAAYRVVVWRPVAREPWIGTFLVLAPLGLLGLESVPPTVRTGVWTYIGASLVVNAIVGYGGCEAVIGPSLVFRRRPTVYCPYNAIDAAERSLRDGVRRGRLVWFAASVLAMVVGAYFLFVGPLLGELGVSTVDYRAAAALLVLPAIVLGLRAWRTYRGDRVFGVEVKAAAVGAVALLAMAVVFAGLMPQDAAWGALMLGGLVFAVGRVVRRRLSSR